MTSSIPRRSVLVVISILVILVFSFLANFYPLQRLWPDLSKPYASAEIIRFDASLSSLIDRAPAEDLLGFTTDIFPDNEAARELLYSKAYLHAYRDYLRTGESLKGVTVPDPFLLVLSNYVRAKFTYFRFAQFSLAPNILVTRAFNFLDALSIHHVDFQWDAGEYPDLVIGHLTGKAKGKPMVGLDEHRIVRDLGNGVVLYKRDR